jgi:hypothetical protein
VVSFVGNLFNSIKISASEEPVGAEVLRPGSVSTATSEAPLVPDTAFSFSVVNQNVGMFILRDDEIVSHAGFLEVYSGQISMDENFDRISRFYEYTAVKRYKGRWLTAQEYEKEMRGTTNIMQDIDDWFTILGDSLDGGVNYTNYCNWQLRITSPAGEYGVRARAKEKLDNGIGWTPATEEYWEDKLDYENRVQDFFFTILYGTDLKQIMLKKSNGETRHDAARGGRKLSVDISANAGAMRVESLQGEMEPYTFPYSTGDIKFGHMNEGNRFYWADNTYVDVQILHNGQRASGGWSITMEDGTSTLDITLPAGLAVGRYILRVTHAYRPKGVEVVGMFIIDNGTEAAPVSASKISGIAFIIVGALGALVGMVLVVGPAISYSINARRYRAIDDKNYGTDARSVRKREAEERKRKADIAKGLIKREHKNRKTFEERIEESLLDRAEAKKRGMTFEEYRAMVSARGNIDDKSGIFDARKILGSSIEITEKAVEEKNKKVQDDNPEFGLVESVKLEALTGTDQFATAGESVRDEALAPIAPTAAGILGRINKALTEEKSVRAPMLPPEGTYVPSSLSNSGGYSPSTQPAAEPEADPSNPFDATLQELAHQDETGGENPPENS